MPAEMISSSGSSRLIVGGATESRSAQIVAIDSTTPAPPSRWPVMDLVADTTIPLAALPIARWIAIASAASPAGVEVACALMWTTCSGATPASARAR